MDPITASLVTSLGTSLVSSIFRPPAPSGPSEAEILALLEAQRRRQEAQRNAWLIGGGIAAAGLIAYLLISRK